MKTQNQRKEERARRKQMFSGVKETMRIKELESVRDLWEDGHQKSAIEKLVNSYFHQRFNPLNEAAASKYCEKYFSENRITGAEDITQATPVITSATVEEKTTPVQKLTTQQLIAKNKELIEKSQQWLAGVRARAAVANAKSEEKVAQTNNDDVRFFIENADDTSACVAKLREMGL